MNKFFIILILLTISSQNLIAKEPSKEKKVLIDRLLEQTNQSAIAAGTKISNLYIQQIAQVLKNSNPDIDPRSYTILEEVVKKVIKENIMTKGMLSEAMYPIYDKYLTSDDLRNIIEFNNTSTGKKVLKVTPFITQEAMEAGQLIGQSMIPEIQKNLILRFDQEGIKYK